jgi:hypothetical protein
LLAATFRICRALSYLGQDENGEASAFVALNTQRQKLSQGDIFNAMLAAGDEAAKTVAGPALEQTGWSMARTSNYNRGSRGKCSVRR